MFLNLNLTPRVEPQAEAEVTPGDIQQDPEVRSCDSDKQSVQHDHTTEPQDSEHVSDCLSERISEKPSEYEEEATPTEEAKIK
mmetsp:Transcript_33604/g.51751  ORF Transcript_33604/g.51751 Transcript_33604/m.51751 type:complete len:83 (-) Transcript_33604:201-449(-)|eukprot:CAMPEP_0170509262 /NCGR_PEP_ID=MMETSP0208-20121228/64935_1 /TAXON_ID=197538 /ORGANISM="Strombidium inclinatum, Strain S3" /LENGTH=82 /DNA_ID=CAMNT_0010792587 /DNA_START=610 /DNA_END=858 /DNA_ORIENTATION=-